MLLAIAVVAVAATAMGAAAAAVEHYDGDVVIAGTPQSDAVVALLAAVGDVWAPDSGELRVNQTAHVRIHGAKKNPLLHAKLKAFGFDYKVMIDDVERMVAAQRVGQIADAADCTDPDRYFQGYQRYACVVEFTKTIAEAFADVANVKFHENIGQSATGEHTIVGVTVRAGGGDGGDRPALFFNGGHHAREWITAPTVLYVLYQLLIEYRAGSAEIVELLNAVDLVFIPVVNPDGLEYTHTNSRMWRKNRAVNAGSSARGVDLNRNYPFKWNMGGSSGSPGSDTYRGPSAASESETQALIKFFEAEGKGRVVVGIDYHSYSQLILRPWGWTRTPPTDNAQQRALGELVKSAIAANGGANYRNIMSHELYPTSGSAGDYFGGPTNEMGGGATIAWTFELRDTGRHGFLLPPDQIVPSGVEHLAAFKLLLQWAKEHPDGEH